MKIALEMSRELAVELMRACETIARVGMGQFGDMFDMMTNLEYDKKKDLEGYLQNELLFNDKSRGISSKSVPEECKVAWDAYQYLRREIAWLDYGKDWRTDTRFWPAMLGVSYDDPMKTHSVEGEFNIVRIADLPDNAV